MTSSAIVRTGAVAAPVLLFGYGTLRLIDGFDGHHDKGGALWNVGHVMFFAAMALLAAMAVGIRRSLPPAGFAGRLVNNLCVAFALVGAACFLWVITGDLFPSFADAAPLPGALQTAGPAAFEVALVVLLFQLVRAHRLPAWSPVVVLFGFLLIPVNLDLLPLAAAVVFAGLLPLAGLGRSLRRAPVSGA